MALPQYTDEVLVTLKSVDPPSSFPFPRRQIFLSKENPTMDIGRTSKRNASLEAAKNNAWFDSAVMSRDHAQLSLDVDQQKVFIKDIGSLHGTFHNGDRLARNTPLQLSNGDTIRFGIPIERGADKYPPCVMETSMEFGTTSSQDRPKVFRVPDESDAEDSCSEADESVRDSAKIARKIICPTWTSRYGRAAQAAQAAQEAAQAAQIDLTLDQQYPVSDVRDNQGPASSFSAVAPVSEDNCVDLTSVSEDEAPQDPFLPDFGSMVVPDPLSSQIAGSTQATDGDISEAAPGIQDLEALSCVSECQDSVSSESDGEEEISKDIDLDDSEDSQSEEEAEGDFIEEDFEEHDDFEDEDMDDSFDQTPHAFREPLCVLAPISSPTLEAHLPTPSPLAAPSRNSWAAILEEEFRANEESYPRLPSIRDAGNSLPKSWAVTPTCRLPSIQLVEGTSQAMRPLPQSAKTGQSLGEKFGKHEYFAAREENRLRISNSQHHNIKAIPTTTQHEDREAASTLTQVASESTSWTAVNTAIPEETSLHAEHSKPSEVTKSVRPSAFDAGSAYEFEKMCLEAQKTLNAQEAPIEKPQVVETTNPTNVEVHTSTKSPESEVLADNSQTPKSLKRKANEISSAADDAQEICEPQAKEKIETRKIARCSTSRPSKRLRRVAEAFGYVALGGVAVMSALIATAPTL